MTDELEQRVIEIIADNRGLKPHKIGLSQRLLHDLGIGGGDADEILMKLEKEFRLDILDFNFDQYFPSEGEISSQIFFFWKKPGICEPLTVQELIGAVRRGRLAPSEASPDATSPPGA